MDADKSIKAINEFNARMALDRPEARHAVGPETVAEVADAVFVGSLPQGEVVVRRALEVAFFAGYSIAAGEAHGS